ncbi:hypothetical protein F383_05067 [Gossypium arboreum]|uniref:Uncharacterized protein n=1 Tax=Gossypium arboreum TaxID=29729 RepID=A0A0B0PEL1_GOSAR|nr:hypothetical protein F383_05067 [Gossypium arboreum]
MGLGKNESCRLATPFHFTSSEHSFRPSYDVQKPRMNLRNN